MIEGEDDVINQNELFGFLCSHIDKCISPLNDCECLFLAESLIEGSEVLRDCEEEY